MVSDQPSNVNFQEEYILNSRGVKLYTCRWTSKNLEPKALIFICHGYAMECSITMQSTAIRLAEAGFALYGIDYEGHGKSDGLQGFINNFDHLIDDCYTYFTSICEKKENESKMRYLLGESMGGAVAILLHWKMPKYWDGAILVAPMCKISDEMKPGPWLISILTKLCQLIPTWKLIPAPDVIDFAFKVPHIRQQIRTNPYCYKGWPRLQTGNELYRISVNIERRLHLVTLPFIVLHGEEDRVTDKWVSKQLYDVAASKDKTLKLYPEMWHGLLYGETPSNIDVVFADIIGWLNERTKLGNTTRLQKELKEDNDDYSLTKCEEMLVSFLFPFVAFG